METDLSLSQLIQRKDHLNILRYCRIHCERKPKLVLEHGRALLGNDFTYKFSNELGRLAALEQICLAALDLNESDTAETCLRQLRNAGIEKSSTRFRMLLARCLEASKDSDGAALIYDDLLKENPSNLMALKRKYCLLKAQPGKTLESAEALNTYLQQNYTDTAGWYELNQLKQSLGDWTGAVFCLEEVLLATPASDKIHTELAECCMTAGDALRSRQHFAQALELQPDSLRAAMGLMASANAYLSIKKNDEFEMEVSKELVKYGAEQVERLVKGNTTMAGPFKALALEYKETM